MKHRQGWIVGLAVLIISALACSTLDLGGSTASTGEPDGWLRYDNGDMNISVYRPYGWEISWYEVDNFDIFEIDGEGYIEVYQFTPQTASTEWSIEMKPGMSASQFLEEIVSELSYVLYAIPHDTESLQSAAGDAICAYGYDDDFGEGEFIGVVMQSNQAIVVFASDYTHQDFEANLPIYESVVENVAPLD